MLRYRALNTLQKVSLTIIRRFSGRFSSQPRKANSLPSGRRSLLAELDRADGGYSLQLHAGNIEEVTEAFDNSPSTAGVAALHPSSSATDEYLVSTPRANKLRKAAMGVNHTSACAPAGPCSRASRESSLRCKSGGGHEVGDVRRLPAVSAQESKESVLRDLFTEAQRHCIRLRKDRRWFEKERRVFRQCWQRNPTPKEVSPFVDVSLAPVAALKLLKHLSPRASDRELIERNLLLHRSVTQSKLVQSSERTLFRCLRCFNIYAARPRTLLRKDVGHSWLEYEAEREKEERARQIARKPHLRKKKYSVGRQRDASVDNMLCCPSCRSPKAQWMMEYVHYRTHS